MKVLVLGGGGREAALAWRLRQERHDAWVLPGNDAIAGSLGGDPASVDAVLAVCRERAIDLVVIGPEALLAAGVADELRRAGVSVLGPGAAGARLETSKAFAKAFAEQHGVRSPRARIAKGAAEAQRVLAEVDGPVVLKLDGLAAGKGVVVCADPAAAETALATLAMRFGEHATFLIEERLEGRELSLLVLTDGERAWRLPPAQDHKRLFDGDRGPNTGGMGAVCPVPWADAALLARIDHDIVQPTLRGLRADGIPYRGVLYFGLMVTPDGPHLLEYNARFGDPEAQALLPMIADDLGAAMRATADGSCPDGVAATAPGVAVAVVLATAGYPDAPVTGAVVRGLDGTSGLVFGAGLKRAGEGLVTAGGRVLAVVGRGSTIEAARREAYERVRTLSFDGVAFRTDIGARSG